MSKKNYSKFMTGAITAAMVASAVAPAASAATEVKANAEEAFLYSDVPATDTHFDNIYLARQYELMTGFTDNTFKPHQSISRSHVVKALGKLILATEGKTIDDYDLSHVEEFDDVPSTIPDKELYNFSLLVKDYGIFTGSNNNLMPLKDITREQMAKVLVEAFDLPNLPGDPVVKDLEEADEWAQEYIQILKENNVTNVETYRPNEEVTRGQFASFLVRAYELVYVDAEAPVLTFDGTTEVEIEVGGEFDPEALEFLVEDNFDAEDVVVSYEVTDADGNVVEFDAEVPGTYVFTYTATDLAGNVSEAVVITVEVVADAELVAAVAAVEVAEASLLEADVAAALELVDALEASDEKILLNARLGDVQDEIDAIVAVVLEADAELELFRALDVVPFVNVNADYINEYLTEITAFVAADEDATTLADIQGVINDVNQAAVEAEIEAEIEAANTAVNAVVAVNPASADFTLDAFADLVVTAEEAIEALPANYTPEDAEEPLAVTLQAQVDAFEVYVENYVNFVEPVIEADTEVELFNELDTNFDNVVEANVGAYDIALGNFVDLDTVEEVQFVIDVVNAQAAVDAFEVTVDTTQADIAALEATVELIADEENAEGELVATAEEQGLLEAVAFYQGVFDELAEVTAELNEAVAAAEAAQAAFVAAGGNVEADVYTDVEAALEAVTDLESNVADLELTSEIEVAIGTITDATVALNADIDALEGETTDLIALAEAIEAAEVALAAFVAAGGEETAGEYIAVTDAVELEVTADIVTATEALEAVTAELVFVAEVNAATTATGLQPLLVELEVVDFNNLTLAQRVEVSGLFLATLEANEFTTSEEIVVALDAEVGEYDLALETEDGGYLGLLFNVNEATTIETTDAALEALDLEEYGALTAAQQLVVAEAVLENRPDGGYNTFAQIIAQF